MLLKQCFVFRWGYACALFKYSAEIPVVGEADINGDLMNLAPVFVQHPFRRDDADHRQIITKGQLHLFLEQMAQIGGCNIDLFCHRLKRQVAAIPFHQYGDNLKDQAVDLLLHSDKKIIQVAEEVGYHDLDYFVNRFIQVKGCTPAKFRKQMQQ